MRILLAVHGFPPGAAGGTEIYAHDLALTLAAGASDQVFVLTRDADNGRPEYDVGVESVAGVEVVRINNTFRACHSLEDSYRNPGFLAAAVPVLDRIAPDVAHIQHLTCLSTELPRVLAARRIPVLLTLNDYWLLCHRGQLLDLDLARCAGPGTAGCARCIPSRATVGPASVRIARTLSGVSPSRVGAVVRGAASLVDRLGTRRWSRIASSRRLAHMKGAVRHVDCFLAPSQTMVDRFSGFGIPAGRLVRCEQGIAAADVRSRAPGISGRLVLAFVGSLLPSKAPHLLLEAAAMMPPGSVTVELVGAGTAYHGDTSYAARLAALTRPPLVRAHGAVPHHEVRQLLESVDALVVPSIWIENAPLVIKEAFAAGLPVIASNLGGMAELVRHDVNGLLFTAGDAGALAVQLRRLRDEPGLLDRLRSGIVAPMTIQEDAAQLRSLYRRLVDSRRSPRVAASVGGAAAVTGERVAAVVLNYGTPEQTWLAVRSLESSFVPPASIIVVDNNSPDGAGAALQRLFDPAADCAPVGTADRAGAAPACPPVRVIRSGRNLGFAGGMNLGIAAALAAGADSVLLVNSDAWLAPDATALLLDAARRRPQAGIVVPVIVSRREPDFIASAGIDYSVATGRMRNRLAGAPLSAVPAQPFEVAAASGCVMLIRRAVFERAGLFDEEYFFSFEDVELCLRAASAGFDTLCVPRARAWHEGSGSMRHRSPRRVYFATRNHLRLASGLEPRRLRRALRGAVILGLNAAYVVTSPDAPLFAGLAAVARGARDHVRGRYGADPAA